MKKWAIWILLLGLAGAGCQPGVAAPTAGAPPMDEPAGSPPAAQSTAIPEPPDPQPFATPTAVQVRQGLAATDPTTVSWGAGRPALVEFFAFW